MATNRVQKVFRDFRALKKTANTVINFFNRTAGDSGATEANTNWPASGNKLPDNQGFAFDKFGLVLRTSDGTPVSASTIAKVLAGVVKIKISDREVRDYTLSEFFQAPVNLTDTVNASIADSITAGPVFIPMSSPEIRETIKGGQLINVWADIPATGQDNIEIGALMKGILDINML